LQAVTTDDGERWSAIREIGVPVVPNFGPTVTASGRWIISGNVAFPYTDDTSGLTGWRMAGIYPFEMADVVQDNPESIHAIAKQQGWPETLCEGSLYQTDDGVLHMLLRGTSERCRCRLYVVESHDDGVTWSAPMKTSFSNNDSKFHMGRLPDKRFYWIGNPLAGNRTPLVLSLSRDGVQFDRHYILGDSHYAMRRPGRWKHGEYGYPHSLIHGDCLYVIVSRQKEGIEVVRTPLAELE